MAWIESLWPNILWAFPALLPFWAVGAYNRLVRLRAAAHQCFATLEAELHLHAELVQAALPDAGASGFAHTVSGELMDTTALAWRSLQAALLQFNAVLSANRTHVLNAKATAALATARSVLETAWQRVLSDGHDLAGAPIPEALQIRWEERIRGERIATEKFNDAITEYNVAIRQFPAVLIAWLFGMRAGRAL